MDSLPISRRQLWKLSSIFALIYFLSPNGLAALPGLTINYLLKDTLQMSASQASYFAALTVLGWALKPLWGILSDAVPFFGYRRKSYLVVMTTGAAVVWFILGQIEHYTAPTLLVLFTLSSIAYAFMDVLCDALMVEIGKPLGLTARFQSVQWTAVYTAAIITGLAGGWVASNWSPQQTFTTNALFPLLILGVVLFFLKEHHTEDAAAQTHNSLRSLREALRDRQLWLLAFFLFFVAFSPSFGAPFFYYAIDTLKFDPMFFGFTAALGAASAALGAIMYGKFGARLRTRQLVKLAIFIGVVVTLFELVYFLPFIQTHPDVARWIYVVSAATLGAVGAITFLVMLNAAAIACPRYSEGTVFATLTAFWNIGVMGASAFGGYLFGLIGLQPLILVSALFTAAAWFLLPAIRFADEPDNVPNVLGSVAN